jgi:hypothetical protein
MAGIRFLHYFGSGRRMEDGLEFDMSARYEDNKYHLRSIQTKAGPSVHWMMSSPGSQLTITI